MGLFIKNSMNTKKNKVNVRAIMKGTSMDSLRKEWAVLKKKGP